MTKDCEICGAKPGDSHNDSICKGNCLHSNVRAQNGYVRCVNCMAIRQNNGDWVLPNYGKCDKCGKVLTAATAYGRRSDNGPIFCKEHENLGIHSAINHPPHYNQNPSGVECITVVEHMTFNVGNAIKYLWRAGLKDAVIQDLEKAKWYIEREIGRLKKNG